MNQQRAEAVVILARGLGKRMRKDDSGAQLSEAQGKAASYGMKGMIPIGRPFLDFVLSSAADAGFTRACLVIGPEHEAVVQHYTSLQPERISIEFAIQREPLGTADAVLAAERICGDDPFVVINSDNYYPPESLRALRETEPPAIAAFARSVLLSQGNIASEKISRFGGLTIDQHDFLERIVPKEGGQAPVYDGESYASMNCWLFDSRIFDACRAVPPSPRNELELTRAVQLAIDEMGMRFKVVKLAHAVLDLTTRSDVAEVQKRLATVNVRL